MAGLISGIELQPKVILELGITYTPDFVYYESGCLVYEDFKGVETERFKLIKKLWKLHGPTVLRVTKAMGAGYDIWPDKLTKP